MAIQFLPVFTSSIATDPAATAAGYLTPTRWNQGVAISGLSSTPGALLYSTDATTLAQSAKLKFDGSQLVAGDSLVVGAAGASTGFVLVGRSGFPYQPNILVGDSSARAVGWIAEWNFRATANTYTSAVVVRDDGAGGLVKTAIAGVFAWSSTSDANGGASDTSFSRISAGVIGAGTGAAGSFAGRLKLTSNIIAGVAVASLNASPTTGEIQSVTDALAPAAGAAVAAGGAAKALVWWNGAQWTVIGV